MPVSIVKPYYDIWEEDWEEYLDIIEVAITYGVPPEFVQALYERDTKKKKRVYDEQGNPVFDSEGNPVYEYGYVIDICEVKGRIIAEG